MPADRPRAAALSTLDAILFDLDGVLTPTTDVHMSAWARLFEPVVAPTGRPYTEQDYFDHIDGRPRYDGVRAMLASRGIELPEGTTEDAPELETVRGLGNRKNGAFLEALERDGVAPYPGSLAFLDAAVAAGIRVAVVTSSRNGVPVLEAAGLAGRFEALVDGLVAADLGLPGKPAPDTYLHGAELLGLDPARCAVIEDATSGVAAGRAGDFGLVVGVDRGAGADALVAAGADVVVPDLADLVGDLTAPTGTITKDSE